MTPFDGQFANNYVLPLAAAAYDSTQKPQGFTQSWEIMADMGVMAPVVEEAIGHHTLLSLANPHTREFAAMLKQPSKPMPGDQTLSPEMMATVPNLHFGWVTADTDRQILTIAIRGTQFLAEWLKDFDLLPVAYAPMPAPLRLVHQGFQFVYQSIRTNLLAQVEQALAAYPALHTVLMTGHSLGAAVVGVAAPDLLHAPVAGLTPLVYTFAEPRVGNPSYASFYDQSVPVCYRVSNLWDVVPHLPPVLAVYEHEGVQVDINSGFSLSVAHNHQLATGYVPGLARWVAQHPAHASLEERKMQVPVMIGVVA